MQKADAYRKRLISLRQHLKAQVERTSDEMQRHLANEGGVSADRDFEGYEGEMEIVDAERTLLEQVDTALAKIDRGQYGQCDACGGQIGAPRLDAIPYADICIDCARKT